MNLRDYQGNHTLEEFRKIILDITGVSRRTFRRWMRGEPVGRKNRLKILAHFKQPDCMDYIMQSDRYASILVNNGVAESMNRRFMAMMGFDKPVNNACDIVKSRQTSDFLLLCDIASHQVQDKGVHTHTAEMVLGDGNRHIVAITSIRLTDSKVLYLMVDNGQVVRT